MNGKKFIPFKKKGFGVFVTAQHTQQIQHNILSVPEMRNLDTHNYLRGGQHWSFRASVLLVSQLTLPFPLLITWVSGVYSVSK